LRYVLAVVADQVVGNRRRIFEQPKGPLHGSGAINAIVPDDLYLAASRKVF
jgi:hypothetical protein